MMNAYPLQRLLRRQWLENRRAYLFFALGLAGILSFLFLVTWHWRTSFSGGVHKGIFLIGLLLGGSLFAGTVFKDLGNKGKSMWFISLPAPAGHKLLVGLLYAVVFYLAGYLALFYAVEAVFRWLVNGDGTQIPPTDLLHNRFYEVVFTYINLQLVVLLGSVYFKKLAYIKTLLLLLVGFALVTNGNTLLLKSLTGEATITSSIPLDYFQFVHNDENVYVYLPDRVKTGVNLFLDLGLPAMLYAILYTRFRETEV